MLNYLKVYAKYSSDSKFHPLLFHMIDSAEVFRNLCKIYDFHVEHTIENFVFLTGLHDIGKCFVNFQSRDKKLKLSLIEEGIEFANFDLNDEIRHEEISTKTVRRYLRKLPSRERDFYANILHFHHGYFDKDSKCNSFRSLNPKLCQKWEAYQDDILDLLTELYQLQDSEWNYSIENFSEIGIRFLSLVVLSDWIASNDKIFDYPSISDKFRSEISSSNLSKQDIIDVLTLYRMESGELAEDVVSKLFTSSKKQKIYNSIKFEEIWPEYSPNLMPLQSKINRNIAEIANRPGLAIIEAPMGAGKTESALLLCENWRQHGIDGFYIALPTMATSNQMHARVSEHLKRIFPDTTKSKPRLVHGMSWILDDNTVSAYDDVVDEDYDDIDHWFKPLRLALLSQFAVGTVDQVMKAALFTKFSFLRLLGLSNKVLVIDEVHAYDSYMTTILERLLRWCSELSVPVVLLSATLSSIQKKRLVEAYLSKEKATDFKENNEYPLFTLVEKTGNVLTYPVDDESCRKKTINLKKHHGFIEDKDYISELALESVENGGCCCVILNTVNMTQSVYEKIKTKNSDIQCFIFHSRFIAKRRNEIEKEITDLFGKGSGRKRPEKSILIATQVVEQSLDVDFDVMISQLAPIDLILQRSGRLHRHNRVNRPQGNNPTFHILLPEKNNLNYGKSKDVYHKSILIRTHALIELNQSFNLPGDFRSLIERCYGEEKIDHEYVASEEYSKTELEHYEKQKNIEDQARQYLISEPEKKRFTYNPHPNPFSETDSNESTNYFNATTRYGMDSISVIIVEEDELFEAINNNDNLSKAMKKEILLHKVNLPSNKLSSLSVLESQYLVKDPSKWTGCKFVIKTNTQKFIDHGFELICDREKGVKI